MFYQMYCAIGGINVIQEQFVEYKRINLDRDFIEFGFMGRY